MVGLYTQIQQNIIKLSVISVKTKLILFRTINNQTIIWKFANLHQRSIIFEKQKYTLLAIKEYYEAVKVYPGFLQTSEIALFTIVLNGF